MVLFEMFFSSLILQYLKLFNVINKIQNPGFFFYRKMTKIITFQRAGSRSRHGPSGGLS